MDCTPHALLASCPKQASEQASKAFLRPEEQNGVRGSGSNPGLHRFGDLMELLAAAGKGRPEPPSLELLTKAKSPEAKNHQKPLRDHWPRSDETSSF